MRRLLPVLSILLLAGCAQLPAPYQGASFGSPTIPLSVGTVLIDDASTSPAGGSQIDNQLQPTPAEQLRNALAARYVATSNGPGLLRITIKEASVIEVPSGAPPTDFFERAFGKGQTFRYEGRMVIETTSERISQRCGFMQAQATRTLEITSDDGAVRARHVQGMVRQLVDDLLVQFDKEIAANMGGVITPTAAADIQPQRSGRWDHVMNDRVRSAGM